MASYTYVIYAFNYDTYVTMYVAMYTCSFVRIAFLLIYI